MPRLSNVSNQTSRQQQQQQQTHGEDAYGTVRNAFAYQRPIGAVFEGQPVTILATGDIAGMSPCFQFVDENGREGWAPTHEFQIVDDDVVPRSGDQQKRLLSQLQR